jgi:hypothetical protein
MVVGIDKFAEHFAEFKDRYVLIGGTATWLVLDEVGLDARATKDLDIVLCIEAMDAEFGRVVWEFIRKGQYQIQEKSDGNKVLYRFKNPSQVGYPVMLELFSRKPDVLVLGDDSHFTPIPIDDEVSSLSAILLHDDYYAFIHQHRREIAGVSLVSEVCLIPLKAKAWLDLSQRKLSGENVDSKNIKKHRSDIYRLFQLLNPQLKLTLPATIAKDMSDCFDSVNFLPDAVLLKQIGMTGGRT